MPGPGAYGNPVIKENLGGKFNLSNPKSDVDWMVHSPPSAPRHQHPSISTPQSAPHNQHPTISTPPIHAICANIVSIFPRHSTSFHVGD